MHWANKVEYLPFCVGGSVCVCVLQWYDIAPLHISALHPPLIYS